jgi:hypothetical protein
MVPLVVVGVAAVVAIAAYASRGHGGALTGTWSGYIVGDAGSGIGRQHIVITVNRRETGGTWTKDATCHGALTLESISNGYHHFLAHLGRGATCSSGDVDCLKRAGANIYDDVTSHLGGEYDTSGTLKRARA